VKTNQILLCDLLTSRATERDRVDLYKTCRPGDIMLAKVISLGEASSGFLLSTAANELGVVVAKHADSGEKMIPVIQLLQLNDVYKLSLDFLDWDAVSSDLRQGAEEDCQSVSRTFDLIRSTIKKYYVLKVIKIKELNNNTIIDDLIFTIFFQVFKDSL